MKNTEIKFRVIFDNHVIGYERLNKNNNWEWMDIDLNPTNGERWSSGVYPSFKKGYIRNQFTGLMSYDGGWGIPSKETYIGDIIKYVSTEGKVYIKEIKWNAELCCICFGNISYEDLHDSAFHQPSKIHFEIIGNIYENKNLLRVHHKFLLYHLEINSDTPKQYPFRFQWQLFHVPLPTIFYCLRFRNISLVFS